MVQGRRLFCWLAHETDFYPHLMNTQNKKRTTIICEVNGVGYFVHVCMWSVCVNAVARVAHAHADTCAICSRVFHSTLFFFHILFHHESHKQHTYFRIVETRQPSVLFRVSQRHSSRSKVTTQAPADDNIFLSNKKSNSFRVCVNDEITWITCSCDIIKYWTTVCVFWLCARPNVLWCT